MRPLPSCWLFALGGLWAAAGCADDVPAQPTYFSDVQAILNANCVRCHGADPIDVRVARFRLDRYVSLDLATFDAYDYAQGAEAPMLRVAVEQQAPAMPPDYALGDRQREVLARWIAHGAPKGTRANRPPQLQLLAPREVSGADQSLEVTLRAWDDDLDGLVVELWAHDPVTGDGQDVRLSPPLGAGQRELVLDTGTLPSMREVEIYAILDDGFFDDPAMNRTRTTLIPRLPIDHGARGTAPTVRLLAPNGGGTLIGEVPIMWSATDPDPGDSLSIGLTLLRVAPDGSTTEAAVLGAGLPNTGSFAWTPPPSLPIADAQGAPIPYAIRVTATDALGMPPNVRSDASDATFSLARPAATSYTWNDVKPILVAYCLECHGEPARSGALEYFRLDKYDALDGEAPANDDLGVFEVRSMVYQRTVATSQMPPGAAPALSAAERERLGSWILGGAPRGGGSGNARPTFTWSSPSATDTTPPVTLQWSAADAEGLASGRLEYAKVNGNPAAGCTPSNLMNATWMTIADPKASVSLMGALTWTDTLVWTPPATAAGYYCVRGVVIDVAGQQTAVANAFGVR